MRRNLFVLTVISLSLLVGCSQQEILTDAEDNNGNPMGKSTSDLVIPSKESIVKEGYPTNENGQTYGSDMGDLNLSELGEPDLMLAEDENGTMGYVKKEDLNGPQPKTPEEAVKLNEVLRREIPLYDDDGETVIGKFIVGG